MTVRFFSFLLMVFLAVPAWAMDVEFIDMPIKELLANITDFTGQSYVFHGDSTKTITWEQENLNKTRLVRSFNTVLQANGFDVGRKDGMIIVTEKGEMVLRESMLAHRFQWIKPQDLVTSLKQVWKDKLDFFSLGETLVVVGSTSDTRTVLDVLKKYDQPAVKEVVQFKLNYIPVAQFMETILQDTELKGIAIGDNWTNSVLVRNDLYSQVIVENYVKRLDRENEDQVKQLLLTEQDIQKKSHLDQGQDQEHKTLHNYKNQLQLHSTCP